MIEEIIIKFGTELKPTQHSWKSQLYSTQIQVKHTIKQHLRFSNTGVPQIYNTSRSDSTLMSLIKRRTQ